MTDIYNEGEKAKPHIRSERAIWRREKLRLTDVLSRSAGRSWEEDWNSRLRTGACHVAKIISGG